MVVNSLTITTQRLVDIIDLGWETRAPDIDYIEWRPRELNKLADYYANLCMERKETWQYTDEVAYRLKDFSIQAFTDGGKRDKDHAAAST